MQSSRRLDLLATRAMLNPDGGESIGWRISLRAGFLPAVDDKMIVVGHPNLTTKATGQIIDSDYVHVITLADGKWLRFRDFMNTAVAVQAFA
ncbi:MAG: nuclear transport factor 2 family protein [Gammaproteobacteria bacterium]